MDKFTQAYIPGCELAVDEAMIGFKGRFFLKDNLPGKPSKWEIKAWGLVDSANGYLLKCDIYKGKKRNSTTSPSTRGTYVRCGCKWWETRVLWCWPIFKRMVEIYITFCPKCVSCELFHLIWPDKSSPLYSTRKKATDLQTKVGASADWYIHVSQAYRQEEKFDHRNCIP